LSYASPGVFVLASGVAPRNRDIAFECDGTDDDVQIQAAIDSLPSGGGKVMLSEGTFTISANITFVSDFILAGQGESTIIKAPSSSLNANMLAVSSAVNDVVIRDLRVDGNSQLAANRSGIRIDTTGRQIYIQNVRVQNCVRGISAASNEIVISHCHITANSVYGVYILNTEHLQIIECTLTMNGAAANTGNIVMDGASAARFTRIVRNVVTGSGRTSSDSDRGILLSVSTGTLEDILIQGCRVSAFPISGITLASPDSTTVNGIRVIGNYVQNCGPTASISGDGIFAGGANSRGITVIGNTVLNVSDTGIAMDAPETICIGNRVSAAGSQGIAVNADRIVCSGNYSKNNGINTTTDYTDAGISLFSSNATNCTIVNNICEDDQGSKTQLYGIGINANATGNIIEGNQLDGNATAGILDNSSGAQTVRNNLGWVTENSGTATINSGATSVTVTHGLAVTPTIDNIMVTMGESPTNDPGNIWVDTITSTQFNINCRSDPGTSNLDFGWKAIVL